MAKYVLIMRSTDEAMAALADALSKCTNAAEQAVIEGKLAAVG